MYEHTYGIVIGSPLSLVLMNLFMDEFEEKVITTAHHRPKFWGRYVDDTGVVIRKKLYDKLF